MRLLQKACLAAGIGWVCEVILTVIPRPSPLSSLHINSCHPTLLHIPLPCRFFIITTRIINGANLLKTFIDPIMNLSRCIGLQ